MVFVSGSLSTETLQTGFVKGKTILRMPGIYIQAELPKPTFGGESSQVYGEQGVFAVGRFLVLDSSHLVDVKPNLSGSSGYLLVALYFENGPVTAVFYQIEQEAGQATPRQLGKQLGG